MRRKPSTDVRASAPQLGVEALAPAPTDDPQMPYPLRRKQHQRWLERRAEWVARREEYAAQHGWRGGDIERAAEEDAAHPIPDAPFDPEWEVAHGHL